MKGSNERGTLTFATSSLNTRSTQLFINLVNNTELNLHGYAPIGKVTQGMDIVDAIYSGYKQEPSQGKIVRKGNKYLEESFPKLSYVVSAEILPN